ncbi:hypothetical protein CEXT_606711 [Caerostris extrusa]|uniref:Uncharacterized protein n=1 Tax=Caerostris extrusa TaxID=172846 RepID=A0AAV4TWS6_CAEEX|nr:hypothetical protein CEXT_606711 [Caerostris extrusa]
MNMHPTRLRSRRFLRCFDMQSEELSQNGVVLRGSHISFRFSFKTHRWNASSFESKFKNSSRRKFKYLSLRNARRSLERSEVT